MKLHASNFRKVFMKRIALALTILMITTLACQISGLTPLSQPTAVSQIQSLPPQVDSANVIPQDGSLEALYQSVIPGVVAIRTDTGEGSGFVFDSEGHVVTNQHVIDGASAVEIDFASGFKAYGTVIGFDRDADVAVIKVDAPAEEIHPLVIGDSSA